MITFERWRAVAQEVKEKLVQHDTKSNLAVILLAIGISPLPDVWEKGVAMAILNSHNFVGLNRNILYALSNFQWDNFCDLID